MSVNKIYVLGRLGKDPELKEVSDGKYLCEFSIATDHSFTKKNGEKESKTTWHSIQVWGVMAQKCSEVLRKGSNVFIEGKQENEFYETNNGETRFKSWIVSKYIQFLDPKKEDNSSQNREYNI